MATQDAIVENETFIGESKISYDDALHNALRAHTISAGPDCTINVVIFGSSYNEEDETYRISIQIIVTRPSPKPEPELHHEKSLEEEKPKSELDMILEMPDDFLEIMKDTTNSVLLQFNHEGIHDVIQSRLEHTWEINPQSDLGQHLQQTVEKHLPSPIIELNKTEEEKPTPSPSIEPIQYKNMRLFTEEVSNLSTLLPAKWHMGIALFEYLYEKNIERKLKKELGEKFEQVQHEVPELKSLLKKLILHWP